MTGTRPGRDRDATGTPPDEVVVARQDSGSLERFAAIFPSCKKMASEVEAFADIERALEHGRIDDQTCDKLITIYQSHSQSIGGIHQASLLPCV